MLVLLEDKKRAVHLGVLACNLPTWIYFQDTKRVEWLSNMVKLMWPFICQFMEKLFQKTLESAVWGANAHLISTKVNVGQQSLKVNGVKVYTENVDKRQIILDLQISFVENYETDLGIKQYFCRGAMKNFQIHGTMWVILEPLLVTHL